jgi:TolB-like protein/tetratricopeptide (TPR) repeat protein
MTVYAGAAFVILELVDMITEPFGLPSWTFKLAVVFLSMGFIVAIILSWIYDIHSEGGIIKTEPAHKVKAEDTPKSSNSWKIASYISFVVIVGLIVLNIIPRSDRKDILDKSIAVLPFKNDSPDEEKMYFINGTMEAILDNLCKIEDLRVPGRTSVEQYRDNPKPIPVVAEEMNVSYILEGSGHRDGDNVRLFVQLLDGRKDQHLWSKSYDVGIEEIFSMQSEIAQLVAAEIEAIITPEEKQLVEKKPTTSLTAHDYFQRGCEEFWKYWLDNDSSALGKAEDLYLEALIYDSTYANAYTGLARVFLGKIDYESIFSEDYLDSVLILSDIALSYDNQLAEAYTIRGQYYEQIGKSEQAIKEFDRAIQLNPNDWIAYNSIGVLYFDHNYVKSIENLHKAISLHRGRFLPTLLRRLSSFYDQAGFRKEAEYYNREALKLDKDSLQFYSLLSYIEHTHGNYAEALELEIKVYTLDTSSIDVLFEIGNLYVFLEKYDEALLWFERFMDHSEYFGYRNVTGYNRIGLAYWYCGYKEEATYYFNKLVDYLSRIDELGRAIQDVYLNAYDMAGVYAFLGEKEKAFEKLRLAGQRETHGLYNAVYVKNDAMFENYRDDPVFLNFIEDVESKYQSEHERVRQWLEENDMLEF